MVARSRVVRVAVGAGSLLLLASLILVAVLALQLSSANDRARIATARQLAAQALALAPVDVPLGSLLAVESNRMHDDPVTRAALFQLANASPSLVRSLDVGAPVLAVAANPDGTRIVTVDAGGSVQSWQDGVATALDPVAAGSLDAAAVAVSGDGSVIVASGGGSASIWVDERRVPLPGPVPVGTAALSLDGAVAAFSTLDGQQTSIARVDAGRIVSTTTVSVGGLLSATGTGVTVRDAAGTVHRYDLRRDELSTIAGARPGTRAADVAALAADGSLTVSVSASASAATGVKALDLASGSVLEPAFSASVAGTSPAALALSADGGLVAARYGSSIEVATLTGAAEHPAPMVLQGAGGTGSALAFGGDRFVVSASGTRVSVFDLRQWSRLQQPVRVPLPDCTGCGPVQVRPNAEGTAVLIAAPGAGAAVLDAVSDTTAEVDPSDRLGLSAITWWDEERLLGYSSTAEALVVVGGAQFDRIELTAAPPLDDGESPLVLQRGPDTAFDTAMLTSAGRWSITNLRTGDISRDERPFARFQTAAVHSAAIAPNHSSAWMRVQTEAGVSFLLVGMDGRQLRRGGAEVLGAGYDRFSLLHLFTAGVIPGQGVVRTLDPETGALRDPVPAEVGAGLPVAMDGSALFAASTTRAGAVTVIQLAAAGTVLGRIPAPAAGGAVVPAFTPDGSALFLAAGPAADSERKPATLAQSRPAQSRPAQSRPAQSRPARISVARISLDSADWVAVACQAAGRSLTPTEFRSHAGTEPPDQLGCGR